MKRLIVIAALLACAGEASASCAPDNYLCQGKETMDIQARQDYEDTRHLLETIHRNGEEVQRELDSRERAADQAFTDSLIMNLDRR